VDCVPDYAAIKKVSDVFYILFHMDLTKFGAFKAHGKDYLGIQFSPEATQFFDKWYEEHFKKINGEYKKYHPIINEHFSKYPSLIVSIALILHLFDIAVRLAKNLKIPQDINFSKEIFAARLPDFKDTKIPPECVAKAAAICDDHLAKHAMKVYALGGISTGRTGAQILAQKIIEGKVSGKFTGRELQQKQIPFLKKKDEAKDACKELIELGWLKEESTKPKKNLKISVIYFINPKVYDLD